MTAKQFHDELTALVSRAFKEGVKKKLLTPEQIAQTLAVHAEFLNRTIQQVRDMREVSHVATAITSKPLTKDHQPFPGIIPSPVVPDLTSAVEPPVSPKP